MKNIIAAILVVFLTSCAWGPNLSRIDLGMSQQEVIDQIGKPKDRSAIGDTIIFTYEGEAGWADGRIGGKFYQLIFIDDVLERYGLKNDLRRYELSR